MVVLPVEPTTLNLSTPISKVPEPEALVKFSWVTVNGSSTFKFPPLQLRLVPAIWEPRSA
ncbi:hypothetical protein ES703_67193 [subsurface metagenome]